mgnify:CR=1 FL=1
MKKIESLRQELGLHRVEIVSTPLQQSFGLMFRKSIPDDYGMWFEFKKPKNVLVHTWFMRFPINVRFFDKDFKLMKIVRCLKPWHHVKVKNVKAVLETKCRR